MPVKINDLCYTYAPRTPSESEAIKDISLQIKDGSFNAFIGQTGSGKSTLIQCLNALLIPTSGSVEIDDFIVTSNKRKNKKIKELRKHVGVVFQFPEYQLFEDTVIKDVAFGPKNFGYSEQDALSLAKEALISVGLDESYFERSPFELSGGEKRRAAIAGILAINPDILILDEPTAGLDPQGTEIIMQLIDNWHKQGKTIILVTHDMDLVLKYAENVFVLNRGQLVFSGTPSALFNSDKLDDMSIEIPPLFTFAKKLKERGFDIDLLKIRFVDDLIEQIAKECHKI